MLLNWRFQLALYRAYYDATIRSRLKQETAQEEKAKEYLKLAPLTGSLEAIAKAEEALAKPEMYQDQLHVLVFLNLLKPCSKVFICS